MRASRSTPAAFDGLPTAEFKEKIIGWLEAEGSASKAGELQAPRLAVQPAALLGRAVPDPARGGRAGKPTGVVAPLTEQDLPLRLPELEDYKPTGSPEAAAGEGDRLGVT